MTASGRRWLLATLSPCRAVRLSTCSFQGKQGDERAMFAFSVHRSSSRQLLSPCSVCRAPSFAVSRDVSPHVGSAPAPAHILSGSYSDVIELDDILALAAVNMFIKLHLSPQQRYARALPELLRSFSVQLTRQPHAYTIQRVAHIQFRMLEQLGYDLGTLTPMAWVDIFRRVFAL